MFIVRAPVPQRAGGDSGQLLRACWGWWLPLFGKKHILSSLCVAPVSPSKWDLPSSCHQAGGTRPLSATAPPLCADGTGSPGGTRAHGAVAVSSPRAEHGVCALHGIPLLTVLLSETCLPPSPEQSGALGEHLLSVSPAGLRFRPCLQDREPSEGRPPAPRSMERERDAGWQPPGAAGVGPVLFVPCVVFPQVTQLSSRPVPLHPRRERPAVPCGVSGHPAGSDRGGPR